MYLNPAMTMQGTTISLGSTNVVAVDTGTTLIGGPSSVIASIYAAIPGSSQMTGAYANYYQYPCSTSINFDITLGGFTISITDQDFNLGRYSSDTTMCTGAAFIQALPAGSPVQWILGDTALKNVYSVYRYNPPAVGFASLAGSDSSQSGVSTTIPVVESSLGGVTGGVTGTTSVLSSSASVPSGNNTMSSSKSGSITKTSMTATSTSNTGSATPRVVTATATTIVTPDAGSASDQSNQVSTTSAGTQVLSSTYLPTIILLSALSTVPWSF
jgi:cathepsin D